MKPMRILFESDQGTLAIEFSRERGELTLVALDGERKTITGERGKMIARKAIELSVLCAVGAMPEDEAEALGLGRTR